MFDDFKTLAFSLTVQEGCTKLNIFLKYTSFTCLTHIIQFRSIMDLLGMMCNMCYIEILRGEFPVPSRLARYHDRNSDGNPEQLAIFIHSLFNLSRKRLYDFVRGHLTFCTWTHKRQQTAAADYRSPSIFPCIIHDG